MRADPEGRRSHPARRRADFLPSAARAWGLVLIFARRSPLLLVGCAVAIVVCHLAPAALLARAHVDLARTGDLVTDFGAWGAAWLYFLMLAGPIISTLPQAALVVAMQRRFLGAGGFAWGAWARVAGALLALKLLALAAAFAADMVPTVLVLTLGPTSTLLTLLLVAPVLLVGCVALVRVSLAVPAMSLGLPKATAESWDISRGHVGMILGAWCVAAAPLVAASTLLAWSLPAGGVVVGLPWLMLAAALTSLQYRGYRLPASLRPDRRPSRRPDQRAEPMLAAK